MDIELVDIVADEGYSASTLKRPGLQVALAMLRRGQAEALIVVKLDRLTRCVKDLATLCEQYFAAGRPSTLLSLSDAIDTRSASGKLVLNVLTSVAQWEREAISDRTREALAHLLRQGVKLGGAPYGWRYSDELDASGRHMLAEVPAEQDAIQRICAMYDADVPMLEICARLQAEGLPPRGPRWHKRTLYRILERAGYEDPARPKNEPRPRRAPVELRRDKRAAAVRAAQLRVERLSLRDIGARLLGEGYLPPRGAQWYAATVLDLLNRPADSRPAA
jgi:DNA invertase Pin-like site-specific DNA recombinase